MSDAPDPRAVAVGRRCVLAAAVLWSLSGVVAKWLDLDGPSIAFYRSLFAGLSLLPFVRPGRRVVRPVMIPAALVFGAMIGLYLAALKATTAANAIFLQCTATFWMVPLSLVLLGERPDRRAVSGILLATVGVVAIVGAGLRGDPGELSGIGYGLLSGVAYAFVAVGLRGLRGLDPLWLSAMNNLGGALTLLAWIVLTGRTIARPDAAQTAVLLAFGVVQMAIPYALFARGLREIGAPEAGLISLLEPVLNPIWVLLVHGERPAAATLVGGAFLLAGVLVRFRPGGGTGPASPVDRD